MISRQMWRIKNGREGYSRTTFFPIITSVDCTDEIKKRVFWNRRVLCSHAFRVRRAAVKLAVTTDISGYNFRLAQVRPTRAARATLLAAGAGAAIRLDFYYCYFNRFRGVDETCTPPKRARTINTCAHVRVLYTCLFFFISGNAMTSPSFSARHLLSFSGDDHRQRQRRSGKKKKAGAAHRAPRKTVTISIRSS